MNIVTNPLTLSAAALALFLAGCGGSDDNGADNRPPTCTGGQVLNAAGDACVDPSPDAGGTTSSPASLTNTLRSATTALTTLAGAADADGSALKMAADAHKKAVDFVALQGVSADVAAYGQKVLDAQKALTDALAAAKTARMDAQDAVSGATGADKTLLEGAIAAADAAIKAGEARRDAVGADTLRARALAYTGTGKTPAEQASTKAKTLHGDSNNSGVFGNLESAPTSDPFPKDRKNVFAAGNTINSATMKKFTELFTTEKIPLGTESVDAVAVKTDDPNIEDDSSLTDTSAVAGTYYDIPGMFHNRPVDDEARWFFVPAADAPDYFVLKADGSGYEGASYVEWGLWLTTSESGVIDGVGHHFAGVGARVGVRTNINDIVGVGGKDVTATYSGPAAGLSARCTANCDEADAVYSSGHFTATAALTATFKAAAAADTLDGSIHTFRPTAGSTGTDHVNESWRLNFTKKTNISAGTANEAYEGDDAPSGRWSATVYGGTGTAHPEGIYGTFNAGFTDGKVTGVYHADKQ